MIFKYDKSWFVNIQTQISTRRLLVDTGAGATCLSLSILCELLGKTEDELYPFIRKDNPLIFKSVEGKPVQVYHLVLPKINVGGFTFPRFYCFVSLHPDFQSLLGMDVLRYGVTHLQYKDKGSLDYFDFESYETAHSSLPTERLSFLNYN